MRRFILSLICLSLFLSSGVVAQDAVLNRLESDLTVRVVNGTSLQAARAERVLVREMGAIMTNVAQAEDVEGSVTFEDLRIFNFKPYVLTAWVEGVAYHAKYDGQHFLDNQPGVVYAFEQTDDLAGLTVQGMNAVVRLQENGFELEYIINLANESRPQRTIRAQALPVRVALPSGTRSLAVEVERGPDPVEAGLVATTDGMQGVSVNLPPGPARITVRGFLPAGDTAQMMVGTNLAVAKWSLLAWPADLKIQNFDLERDSASSYTEFSRWVGDPLEPNDQIEITIGAPPPEEAEEVFDRPAPNTQLTSKENQQPKRRFPWITIIATVILLGSYIVWKIRR